MPVPETQDEVWGLERKHRQERPRTRTVVGSEAVFRVASLYKSPWTEGDRISSYFSRAVLPATVGPPFFTGQDVY